MVSSSINKTKNQKERNLIFKLILLESVLFNYLHLATLRLKVLTQSYEWFMAQ